MNQKIKKYWPFAIVAVVCFLWFQSCENQKAKIFDLETEAKFEKASFYVQKNKLGEKVALQEKNAVNSRKLMKKLTSEVDGLRKINMQLKASVETVVIEVESEPVETVVIKKDTVLINGLPALKNYLELPQAFEYKSEWIKVNYSIDSVGKSLIDTAKFISKPVISFGYKDQGIIKNLVKAPVALVSYEDKNPFSNVKELKNIEYKKRPKWYQRKIVWLGAGFVGGVLLLK